MDLVRYFKIQYFHHLCMQHIEIYNMKTVASLPKLLKKTNHFNCTNIKTFENYQLLHKKTLCGFFSSFIYAMKFILKKLKTDN